MNDLGLPQGVIGMELKSTAPAVSTVRDGNEASPENLIAARLQFPEAAREDYEQVGKRKWRDRASGTVYREFPGAALLSIGAATTGVVAFFIDGPRLVFLERLDMPQGISIAMTGPLRSGQVVDGAIRWTS